MTTRQEAYEQALFTIARATVQTRQRTHGFRIPTEEAQNLLVQCEHALSSLIALGAIPEQPGQAPALPSAVQHYPAGRDNAIPAYAVRLLLVQIDRDRHTAYWGQPPHLDSLDAAEAYLRSLLDWIGP